MATFYALQPDRNDVLMPNVTILPRWASAPCPDKPGEHSELPNDFHKACDSCILCKNLNFAKIRFAKFEYLCIGIKRQPMPANKNAVIRYQILDELLSDRHHYYTRKDLCEKCNEKLIEKGYPEVSKRTIELDLYDIDTEFDGISIDWEFVKDGKHIVRYEDQSRSIFTKKLSDDETRFLNEVLNTLGQFSGLDNFVWLDSLQARISDDSSNSDKTTDEKRAIISFSKNPYLNNEEGSQVSNALAGLFSAIANKVVVNVEYRKFGQEKSSFYDVYPYLLKQYNDRWYLICQLVNAERDFLMNLPLDRMFAFREAPEIPYKECYCDIEERYEDIVGITYHDDREVETILFAISKSKAPYIKTKPILWFSGVALRIGSKRDVR